MWPYYRIIRARPTTKAKKDEVAAEPQPTQYYHKGYTGLLRTYGGGLGEKLAELWPSLNSYPNEERNELAALVTTRKGPNAGVHAFVNRMALVDHYMQTAGCDLGTAIRALYSQNKGKP